MKQGNIFGAALIVAGTSIGAGMLALPVVTAPGGFFPAVLLYLFCWALMTMTGLFLVEISLKMPDDSNIISMSERYLGKTGKLLAWFFYLFLFYSLSTAYISIGGTLLGEFVKKPSFEGAFFFTTFLGSAVFLGTKFVDRLNVFLMMGLVFSYALFFFFGLVNIDISLLKRTNFLAIFPALPIVFTAFSYQGTIPSLVTYLKRDKNRIKKALVLGTTMVFFVYIIWEALILGIVSYEGQNGLKEANLLQQSAIKPLRKEGILGPIFFLGESFSFFAIATSFLGVTMGLFDFLADGLKIPKIGWKKGILWLITFVPSMLISCIYPSIFFTALDYAGGVGCGFLLVLLPSLMVFISRFVFGEKAAFFPRISKKTFQILLSFIIFALVMEMAILCTKLFTF